MAWWRSVHSSHQLMQCLGAFEIFFHRKYQMLKDEFSWKDSTNWTKTFERLYYKWMGIFWSFWNSQLIDASYSILRKQILQVPLELHQVFIKAGYMMNNSWCWYICWCAYLGIWERESSSSKQSSVFWVMTCTIKGELRFKVTIYYLNKCLKDLWHRARMCPGHPQLLVLGHQIQLQSGTGNDPVINQNTKFVLQFWP